MFVPAEHTFPREALFAGAGPRNARCHRAAHDAVTGLFFTAPLLGAARGLLNSWIAASASRPPAPPRSARNTHTTLAAAAGQISAAELLIERAAATADRQPALPPDLVVRSRLDYVTAADLLTETAHRLFRDAGTHATTRGGALPRLWRDIQTAAVHPALNIEPTARAYARLHLNQLLGSQ